MKFKETTSKEVIAGNITCGVIKGTQFYPNPGVGFGSVILRQIADEMERDVSIITDQPRWNFISDDWQAIDKGDLIVTLSGMHLPKSGELAVINDRLWLIIAVEELETKGGQSRALLSVKKLTNPKEDSKSIIPKWINPF